MAAVGETNKQIACEVAANPTVTEYQWTYDDGSALRNGIFYNADKSVIFFDKVTNTDFRIYICTTTYITGDERVERSFEIYFEMGT